MVGLQNHSIENTGHNKGQMSFSWWSLSNLGVPRFLLETLHLSLFTVQIPNLKKQVKTQQNPRGTLCPQRLAGKGRS